ncbi:putative reverse transcriptase domain-containing protein, partial [Tanacetum coccineum]
CHVSPPEWCHVAGVLWVAATGAANVAVVGATNQRWSTTVNGDEPPWTTVGPPVNHRSTVSKEEHEVHLKLILELLRKEKLFAKFLKCEFWPQERFLVNFTKIAKPLTSLTQKDKKYDWGEEQKESFQTLKDNLCNAPILTLPNGPDDFVVYYDALNQGLGCVPMQKGKVISYAFKIHEKIYTTRDLELAL